MSIHKAPKIRQIMLLQSSSRLQCACPYVCVCVCVCVCAFVCASTRGTALWKDGRLHSLADRRELRLCTCLYVSCVNTCVYVRPYVCVHVCMLVRMTARNIKSSPNGTSPLSCSKLYSSYILHFENMQLRLGHVTICLGNLQLCFS
jgi:hypothetical protein